MEAPPTTTDDPCEWPSCQEPSTLTSRLECRCRRWCKTHSLLFAIANPRSQWSRDQAVAAETVEDENEDEGEEKVEGMVQEEMAL